VTQPHHETIYLRSRCPCWHCSRQLMRMRTGEHRGKYAAVRVDVDGYERFLHVQCFKDWQAEEAPQTPPDPRTDWLTKGART